MRLSVIELSKLKSHSFKSNRTAKLETSVTIKPILGLHFIVMCCTIISYAVSVSHQNVSASASSVNIKKTTTPSHWLLETLASCKCKVWRLIVLCERWIIHESACQQIKHNYIADCSKKKWYILCHFKSELVWFRQLIAFMSAQRINIIGNQTYHGQHMVINYHHRTHR